MNKLVKPKKLNTGDLIGIISPSAGLYKIFSHRFHRGVKTLEDMGFSVKIAKHAKTNLGYVSGTPEERAKDIHDMFLDPQVKAIICSIGGNHSNQILKYLDFNIIKSNPKIFIGYSDISVLHYAFMSQANLQTFYGPCLMTQFGEYPNLLAYTSSSFNKVLLSTTPIGEIYPSEYRTSEILDRIKQEDLTRPRNFLKSGGYEWMKRGTTEGILLGGCIPSINHLIGTKFWLKPDNSIFFLDIPEGANIGKGLDISLLDAYLSDLDNIGLFSSIQGLIIGRPYNYSPQEERQLKNLIFYYTKGYNYPILYNVNIGHCDPILTLPLGVKTKINSEKNCWEIQEAGVI